jgi:hypothetical protein
MPPTAGGKSCLLISTSHRCPIIFVLSPWARPARAETLASLDIYFASANICARARLYHLNSHGDLAQLNTDWLMHQTLGECLSAYADVVGRSQCLGLLGFHHHFHAVGHAVPRHILKSTVMSDCHGL